MKTFGLTVLLAVSACAVDDDELETSTEESASTTTNKLGVNKLGVNKLGVNSLATTDMMANEDSREVYSYVVGCALPSGQSITALDAAGNSYTFAGALGLAPAWATRAPTVSERRWVTACLLARTNLYGVSVNISIRHDTNLALLSSASERATYTNVEGAFFGDLFATPQTWYACSRRTWSAYSTNSLRMCALSSNGSTTDCGFTYVGDCAARCSDRTAPFGACLGGTTSFSEVITIFLTPSQQSGGTQ
ncbi:MAG TPA: hypothetical protein VK427_07300 [Kofleriaceae bacterium]|nr:hypothetical protein [Kofleriaceae bacterium]